MGRRSGPLRLVVAEHQALHICCPACQQVSVGSWPAGAPSRAQDGPRARALAAYLVEECLVPLGRVQQLLHDLFGVQLARGTLVEQVQQATMVPDPVEAAIKSGAAADARLHPTDRITVEGVLLSLPFNQ